MKHIFIILSLLLSTASYAGEIVEKQMVNNKIDILWMVDSSGSMMEEQQNLASNFNVFIRKFLAKGYEFRIAVASTDAWRYEYDTNRYQNLVRFRDGDIYTGTTSDNSGVHVINNCTANIIPTFMNNVNVGTIGSGDERAFDSIRQVLTSSVNIPYNFRRDDAFLAVVIMSDEEDFSRNNPDVNGCASDPLPLVCQKQNLRPVSEYLNFLDTYTHSSCDDRNYAVHAIGVFDQACMNSQPSSSGHMGLRYLDLVNQTSGVSGSICDDDFSPTLDKIQTRISELSTQFKLSQKPLVNSIEVQIDGVTISKNSIEGWTYDSARNSIVFHGDAIPAQGARIQVSFDPVN